MNAKKAAAVIGIKADNKALKSDLASARKQMRAFGNDVKKISGKTWGGGKAAIAGIGAGIGAAATFSLTSQIEATRAFEKNLTRLQIATGRSTSEMDAMRESIQQVSKATAISMDEILAGTQTYVDLTGDVAGATSAMSAFARISQASGASVEDIATATAALRDSMQLDPADIEAVFGGLIAQGKAGAVTLKDFASELTRVAPLFKQFGGSGVEGIADLGASLQIVKKNFGDANQAAVGMQNLMNAMAMKAGEFSKAGVKIFKVGKGGKKQFRGWLDIIDQISNSKLANSPDLLAKAFGSSEANRAFMALRDNRAELEKLYQAGSSGAGVVGADLETMLASPAGRIEQAMNNLKVAVAEAFTPERIAAFVEAVESAAGAVGKVIDGLTAVKDYLSGETAALKNPYEQGGTIDREDGEWQVAISPISVFEPNRIRKQMVRGAKAGLPGEIGADARIEQANREAYDSTIANIKSRRTRDDRLRAAVAADMTTGDLDAGEGAGGRALAGSKYLDVERKAGRVTDAEIGRYRNEAMSEQAMRALAKTFVSAMEGANITVKLDSSTMQKAVNNAPVHRGGGG